MVLVQASKNAWIYIVGFLGAVGIVLLLLSQGSGGFGGSAGFIGDVSLITTPTADAGLNVPFDVASSPDLQSVSEARESLANRGFEDFELLTFFNIDGDYLGPSVLESAPSEMFPAYSLLFHCETTDTVFALNLINGHLHVKTPFVLADNPDALVMIVETDFMTGYDPDTDTFVHHVPAEDEALVIRVPTITSQFLESLTPEEIGVE